MSGVYWLADEEIQRLRPHFPKSHGKPKVDDRRVPPFLAAPRQKQPLAARRKSDYREAGIDPVGKADPD